MFADHDQPPVVFKCEGGAHVFNHPCTHCQCGKHVVHPPPGIEVRGTVRLSDSPTHPDAPRAGGETPGVIEIGGRRFTRNVVFTAKYPNQRWLRIGPDGSYHYAGADEWLDRIDALQAEVAELRASLLERRRDGERAEPAASPEPTVNSNDR